MKTFYCDGCGSLVFFENVKCVKCGHQLGFLPAACELTAFEPAQNETWRVLDSRSSERLYRQCENGHRHAVCNWMVPVDDPDAFCLACRLNELIPDLSVPGNQERWHNLELAKRRVVYTILRLRLPMDAVPGENRPALHFKFVGDVAGGPAPLTGHLNGIITVNIAEADDAERELRRVTLHEPYRTLLGHLRHETAHYYWDRLIANSEWLPSFRTLFGDETADYTAALQKYHAQGPPPDWQERHVSAYASAHPWEDWAETGAHYFHILDMVETAEGFGMIFKPQHPAARSLTAQPRNGFDGNTDFDAVLENWFPLAYTLNALNRGMGLLDAYPFVLSTKATEKLRFFHEVVQARRPGKAIDRLPDHEQKTDAAADQPRQTLRAESLEAASPVP